MKQFFLLITLSLITTLNIFPIPENNEARSQMIEYITAPKSDVLKLKTNIIEQTSNGNKIKFEIKQQNGSFYILFINQLDNRFPIYSPGTYIIKRDLSDGKFKQIKVFLKAEEDCYIRFFPLDERAMMDIYLYGKRIYNDINLSYSFANILTKPLNEIIQNTSVIINWELILGKTNTSLYQEKNKFATQIETNLHKLKEEQDGAIDQNGKYIYIENLQPQPPNKKGLNCSGFVKWATDSIYFAETKKYMPIETLKQKNIENRGNRWSYRNEDDRDPYFGLDWTRNIAITIKNAQNKNENNHKSADVTTTPWFRYTPDIGFQLKNLKLIMYYLAKTEPENIYLAAINKSWGKDPILQQHIHTAVLIPIIDKNNNLQDNIYESNQKTSAQQLINKIPKRPHTPCKNKPEKSRCISHNNQNPNNKQYKHLPKISKTGGTA